MQNVYSDTEFAEPWKKMLHQLIKKEGEDGITEDLIKHARDSVINELA